MILLACGYRGMGKDTFYKFLKSGRCIGDSYRIYKKKDIFHILPYLKPIDSDKYIRLAFADQLKLEVGKELDMSLEDIDKVKELPIKKVHKYKFTTVIPKETPTYRDTLIDRAAYWRNIDIDHWVKIVAKKIGKIDSLTYPVITNFRYKNEIRYIINIFHNVVTIRITRDGVKIPDISVKSEHNLDNYFTDYILQPIDEKIKKDLLSKYDIM